MNIYKESQVLYEYHWVNNKQYRVQSTTPWVNHGITEYYKSNGTPNKAPQENKGDLKILKKANEKARNNNM